MKQATLNHQVARLTGESVQRIRRMGFSLVKVPGPARLEPARAVARRIKVSARAA